MVRIGLSGLSPAAHYELGKLVQEAAARLGRRVVFVASGDLSHKLLESGPYGFAPEGPVFDERIEKDFSSTDFLDLLEMDRGFAERAAECGLRSFQIMGHLAWHEQRLLEIVKSREVIGVRLANRIGGGLVAAYERSWVEGAERLAEKGGPEGLLACCIAGQDRLPILGLVAEGRE